MLKECKIKEQQTKLQKLQWQEQGKEEHHVNVVWIRLKRTEI